MVDPTAFARIAAPQQSGLGGGLASIIAGEQSGRLRRAEATQQEAESIAKSAISAWRQNDRAGYQARLQQLSALDPRAAQDINATFSTITAQNLGEAGINLYAATASPDMAAQKKLIGNAKDILRPDPNSWMAQGLDKMMATDDSNKLNEELFGTVDMLKNLGMLPGAAGGAGKQVPFQKTGSWLVEGPDGKVRPMVGSYDPMTSQLTTQFGQPLPEGYRVVGKEGEAPQERRAAEVEKAKQMERTKFGEQRIKQTIDRGITAAESIPNLKRGLELLDLVETGGVRAAGLRVKQLFGIETGDEGELSNRLSKAVLSQLRDTFGAAFTENEGKRLERIEAGFSKNTATNKRLLNQALRMAMRKAEAAKNAAQDIGDTYTMDEIDDLMSFSYSLEDEPAEKAQQKQMQVFKQADVADLPNFTSVEQGEQAGVPRFIAPGPDGRPTVYEAE